MNDRPSGGEDVVLVHIYFPNEKMEEDLNEFKELALSAGAKILSIMTCTRRAPGAKYFIGVGKAEEIRDVAASKAALVIFNHNLTPAQERNLESLLKCRVLDRTGLILDIFAQRARSFEGKLQVELAQLKHLSTRLVRGWTHLERQRGGIGLRGPGETQLETDRRLIRNRIKVISVRLIRLKQQRALARHARRKATVPTVALVGYTNVGKSTLFNRLTGAKVYVAHQLFATLDPTLRKAMIPQMGPVIFADTVGFIRHLPHQLIEAFHATLEEIKEADLLLHVVDAHDEQKDIHIQQVRQVLENIQAEHVPCFLVYNKVDLEPHIQMKMMRDDQQKIKKVFVSSKENKGITELLGAIKEILAKDITEQEIILTPRQAKIRAELYTKDAVLAERVDEEGHYHLRIRLSRVELEKFLRRFKWGKALSS